MVPALLTGQLDGFLHSEPTTTLAIVNKSGHLFMQAAHGDMGPDPPPAMLAISSPAQKPPLASSPVPSEARAAVATVVDQQRPTGKLGHVLNAVAATRGASLDELVELTGWQPHTVRAALTRLRQRGFAVNLRETDDRKAYHLAEAVSP